MAKAGLPLARTEYDVKSPILQFNPFLDSQGVIRSKSRLENHPSLEFDQKFPIILHRRSEMARLITEEAHVNYMHPVSITMMKAKIREKYAILGLGTLIDQLLRRCTECRRIKADAAEQQMGPLPEIKFGVKQKAFDVVGIDFAGPFWIKVGKGQKRMESYILVFTCLAVRAIHLEATMGQKTHHVINAISRFCDLRGVPTTIVSDNGTSFHKADKTLIEWYNTVDWKLIEKKTGFGFRPQAKGINWVFNPPYAPHFGGVFEIMVKAAKRALGYCLKKNDFTIDEFQTTCYKIAMLINNRPIQYKIDARTSEPKVITPNDFLLPQPSHVVFPPDMTEDLRQYYDKRLDYQDEVQQHIWQRFNKEIIPEFGPRKKWRKAQPDLKVDDVVMDIDDKQPRGLWKIRRVHSVVKSSDGMIRRVELFAPKPPGGVAGKVYSRAIQHCIPIC